MKDFKRLRAAGMNDILTNRYVSMADLEKLDLQNESSKTSYLFIINLVTMVISILVLLGILIITLVVYFADSDIQLLHEMKDVDSSIFKHELG